MNDDVNKVLGDMSGSDDATLAELSDKEIFLNVSSISDLCSSWNSRVNALNLTADRVNSDFSTFVSYGILENYIKCLATAINSLTATISQVNTQINNTKNNQVDVDYQYSGGNNNSGTNYNGSNSSGGSNNYGGSNYTSSGGNHSNTSSNTSVNNNNHNTNIGVGSSTTPVNGITDNDYLGISTELFSIATSTNTLLGNLLSDEKQATVIKEKLLASVNISDELKNVITSMEPEVLRQTLKSMYSNGLLKDSMSSDSISYLYKYLEKVAALNEISVSELITNSTHKELLYSSINDYNAAVGHLDKLANNSIIAVRNNLLQIYDGDQIQDLNKNVVDSVRNVLDILSENNDTSYEYLLNNGAEIRNAVGTVSSAKDFVGSLAGTDSTRVQNVVSSLFSTKS